MAIGSGDGSIILSTKIDETGIKKGFGSIGKMASDASKAILAIGAAATAATVAITKMAVDAYAEYEQLVGGVDTLFKDSAEKVKSYAMEAFRTTGQSANEYMQNVTAFSASLLSAVGGDTEKAAEVANAAMISISDNVNKMGSSAESVQLAFQGFAKQQYMLLDNLKLGYGGTKGEMERLLKDAQAITGVEYNIDNLADVYTAIGVIQEKLGIAGTTAKEASTTISGSAATMKAAWQNVLTAISGGGDLDRAIENLVDSINAYFQNILPVVERSLMGIGQTVSRIAPLLVQTIAKALIKAIPSLLFAVYQMIIGIANGIYEGIKALFSGESKKVLTEQAEQIKQTAQNQKEVTNAVKDTNKELKKSTASFDDIEILSSQSAENANVDGLNGGVDAGLQGIGGNLEGAKPDGSAVVQEVNTTLALIMAAVGASLAAVGLILLAFGQIPLGIGFIIAGAITVGVSAFAVSNKLPWEVKAIISIISTLISTALIVVGVVLLCYGIIPLGIGFIIAGAAGYASVVALNWNLIYNALTKFYNFMESSILGPIGLLILGLIFVCAGFFPLGFSLMGVGAGALTRQIIEPNWDLILDKIKDLWNKLVNYWNIYVKPGLDRVGESWDRLYSETLEPAITKLKEKVLDPFLAFLRTAFVKQFENSLQKAGNAIKGLMILTGALLSYLADVIDFINNVFQGDWDEAWGWIVDIFKFRINLLIAIFEKGINSLINGVNTFLDKFDGIATALGELTGNDWVSIPDIGQIKIPRLAQGTVVPPNREFLSILGDNTREHEIVSPISTMKQAFTEAMLEIGSNFGGGNTEVVLEIDGRVFGRAVVEQGNRENRRIGTRLVID